MLNTVGSRIELERYVDSLKYNEILSLERLNTLRVKTDQASEKFMQGRTQQRLQNAKPSLEASQVLLHSASTTALDVKAKIEDALKVYENAVTANTVVEQVSMLRSSVQGIHAAMELRDWERAAELVSKALKIPRSVAEGSFASKMVPSAELPTEPMVLLKEWCDEMQVIFESQFKQAASAALKLGPKSSESNKESNEQADDSSKAANVSRFFKLFPLIGRPEAGLKLYAQFICQIIAQMARRLLKSAAKATMENPLFYAAALSKLFENVAVLMNQHSRLIQRHYGHESLLIVLPQVQTEIDKQALLIVDTFWDERRMEMLLVRCKQYSYPVLINTFLQNDSAGIETNDEFGDNTDLKEAGHRIGEISTMLNRFYLYVQFVQNSFGVALKPEFSHKVKELLGPTFSAIALYVFRRSVEIAVHLDELPTLQQARKISEYSEETPLASSLVDDVVYVLTNVLQQILDTKDQKTVEVSLMSIKRVLESDLVGTLQRKLRSVSPSSATISTEFAGVGPFIIYMNDLQILMSYVHEVIKKHEQQQQEQPREQQTEILSLQTKVNAFLLSLESSFTNKCNELLNDGCRTLFSNRLLSYSKQTIQAFKNGTREFELLWREMLQLYKQLMHPKILSRLLLLLCRQTAADLEQYIWSLDGKVSASSLLELESDVSATISCCIETQYSLRQCFTKLAQIVNALVEGETSGLTPDDANRVARFKVN